MKCPFFVRRTSSYRYSGLKCSANFEHGQTLGDITLWSKEERENKIKKHCDGCFEECNQYQSNRLRGGRL